MVIVPCLSATAIEAPKSSEGCTNAVMVEAFIQNKDVGFVHVGHRVAIKLEAFDFTAYGLIDGTVDWISRDAIDRSQAPIGTEHDQQGRSIQPGLVYVVRITLDCGESGRPSNPLCARIGPGMAASAEIKTGKRRIIDYLLSPIAQTLGEAGRER